VAQHGTRYGSHVMQDKRRMSPKIIATTNKCAKSLNCMSIVAGRLYTMLNGSVTLSAFAHNRLQQDFNLNGNNRCDEYVGQ